MTEAVETANGQPQKRPLNLHELAHDVAQALRFEDSTDDWYAVRSAALRALEDLSRERERRELDLTAENERLRLRVAELEKTVS